MLRLRTDRFSVILINALKLTGGLLFFTPIIMLIEPGWISELTLRAVLLTLFTCITGPLIAWTSYIKAVKETDVSIVHPVMSSYPLVAITLDAIFFRVTPSLTAILGFISILGGMALLLRSSTGSGSSLRGLPFAFLTLLLWGLNSFLFKIILFDIPPVVITYLRLVLAVPIVWTAAFFLRNPVVELRKNGVRGAYLPLLAGLLNDGVSMLLFFSAINIGPLYIVLPLSGTSPFFSGLLSLYILKEPVGKLRFSGILLVILGISLITVFR
jgi:drug/metabolite transporter (DMT)-like permease